MLHPGQGRTAGKVFLLLRPKMKPSLRILFLCTGNSCRSIIAEALANHLGQGRLQAFSAGSHPAGHVNANALAVLARHGIPVGTPRSQSWDDYADEPLDLVITVCDAAAGESCPLWLGNVLKVHWGVPDPAHATGTPEEIEAAFERTYRQMKARMEALLALPLQALAPEALREALTRIQTEEGDA